MLDIFLRFYFISIICINLNVLASTGPTIDSDPQFDFKVSSILNLIKSNKWTCSDIVNYFLERAVTYDSNIKSIISYNPNALLKARELDVLYSRNKTLKGKLHCVPMLIKDNIDMKGIATTGGLNVFRNQVPNKNALVINRLESEGAIFIAKTNMAQLAIGAKYESEQVGLCLNPFDKDRTCSGSSSGSAAGISAGLAVVSLGTDTGGSIIGPSAFSGVYGLRAPYSGTTILDGLLPVYEKRDTVGPLAKHLDDLILTYSIINNDMSLYKNVVSKPSYLDQSKLKVKIITNFLDSFKYTVESTNQTIEYFVDPLVRPLIIESVNRIKSLGINVQEYTLNQTELNEMTKLIKTLNDLTVPCMVTCLPLSYNKYFADSDRYQSDAPFKSFTDLYSSPLFSTYWKDQIPPDFVSPNLNYQTLCENGCSQFLSVSEQFQQFSDKIFQDVDAIIYPSISIPPKLHNETHITNPKDEAFTSFSVNTGNAFLSMPSGFTPAAPNHPDGLPFGMALVIKKDRMENGFKIAKLYESKQSFVKLPSSVPLFKRASNSKEKMLPFSNLVFFLAGLVFLIF